MTNFDFESIDTLTALRDSVEVLTAHLKSLSDADEEKVTMTRFYYRQVKGLCTKFLSDDSKRIKSDIHSRHQVIQNKEV